MFNSSRKRLFGGSRRRFAGLAIALAVVFALPGISNALTSGEEFAQESFTIAEIAAEIGADSLYAQGLTGEGVTVAVIDTGVADVPGLSGDKVIYGPDLSFESGVEEFYNVDTYGHGTVMASIIAGNDGDPHGFRGVAPGARILAVKVADNTGAVDVTQVIAAIDFVIETKDDSGVRIINLSYKSDGGKDASTDPLVAAVERAWDAGIVVVVAAGNDGSNSRGLGNPAVSPYVIAVGAAAEKDSYVDYTSTGTDTRNPDLLAPGNRVLGLASPNSRLVQENKGAFIDERFLRGSGTSQAAAVVSGAAALLLEQRPELTPDQLKALLMGAADSQYDPGTPAKTGTLIFNLFDSSNDVAGKYKKAAKRLKNDAAALNFLSDTWTGVSFAQQYLEYAGGAGRINVGRAAGFPTLDIDQRHERSNGKGSLDDARGSSIVTMADGTELTGDVTFTGSSWSGSSWSGSSWSGSSWSGSSWSGSSWSGSSWSGSSWSGSSWSGSSWSGSSWSGSSWSGSSWSGSSWSGSSWSGSSWSGSSWSGVSWN
ncbi:S8 family serine peptidase [Acidimicrobiaceae bacterium AH-315-P05]|nr:S8 family serine peptidase [Acidimicrobiaceae bacterium AH-315-P05]